MDDLNELAKVHAASYASPHHIIFTLDGLRSLIAALSQPAAAQDSGHPIFKHRLRSVLEVVQRYLPPDGLSAPAAMSKITELVDPWPWPLSVEPPEWAQGESFIGESVEADFGKNTWTFKMRPGYTVGAGRYRISYIGLDAPKATP